MGGVGILTVIRASDRTVNSACNRFLLEFRTGDANEKTYAQAKSAKGCGRMIPSTN